MRLGLTAKRAISIVALLAALALSGWIHSQGGLSLDPNQLRARIAEFGWLAPVGFMLVAGLRPLLLMPSWVIMSVGGLLFGVAGGVLIGTAGFTLGATLMFSISRGLGRDIVEGYAGQGRMARVDAYLTQRGPVWMAVWTGLPVTPLTPVHAAAGLSGMPALGFVIAVVAGFLPRTALYSYFGDSLTQGDLGRVALAGAVVAVSIAAAVVFARRSGATSVTSRDDSESHS